MVSLPNGSCGCSCFAMVDTWAAAALFVGSVQPVFCVAAVWVSFKTVFVFLDLCVCWQSANLVCVIPSQQWLSHCAVQQVQDCKLSVEKKNSSVLPKVTSEKGCFGVGGGFCCAYTYPWEGGVCEVKRIGDGVGILEKTRPCLDQKRPHLGKLLQKSWKVGKSALNLGGGTSLMIDGRSG